MSYILEALKKAQAERAHGVVPGVNAQPVPTIAARAPIPMGAWIIVLLVLLAASAVLYWQGPWSGPGRGLPAVVAPVPATIDAPAPAADVTRAPEAAAEPATIPTPAPAQAPTPARPMRKLGERAPGDPAPAAPTPAPAPSPERIALLQELPAQIQRDIPALAINGYIYASNPADRSVLINNRLRREGDTLGEGFVLEKLLPKEMVLNYRGYRYRINY